jgi:hypothetical protein
MSLPLPPQKNKEDNVAQLVEHRPFKAGVLGSNPSIVTKKCHREMAFLFSDLSVSNHLIGGSMLNCYLLILNPDIVFSAT